MPVFPKKDFLRGVVISTALALVVMFCHMEYVRGYDAGRWKAQGTCEHVVRMAHIHCDMRSEYEAKDCRGRQEHMENFWQQEIAEERARWGDELETCWRGR